MPKELPEVAIARLETKFDAEAEKNNDRHHAMMEKLVKVEKHDREILIGKVILVFCVILAAAEFPNLAKLIRELFV